MRVAIAAAGGGHFSPALAVIESLPKDTAVLVIGRKYGLEGDKAISLEYNVCKKRGIPFVSIITGRLQRRVTRHTLPSLAKMPIGFGQAMKILQEFRPTVVLSFGGYISLPVIFAAAMLRIPIVIHEQTLSAGLANKMASRFAQKICISWQSSAQFFPKEKTVLTGNPVRQEIQKPATTDFFSGMFEKEDLHMPLLYVTGGSLGSHPINLLVEESLEQLLIRYRVFHQTGDAKEFGDSDRLSEKRKSLPAQRKRRYHVVPFLNPEDTGAVMDHASLVISRSGIGTVTELLYFGKPSLLIPLPHAKGNEQLENALFLKEHGIAEVLQQGEATPEVFLNKISQMLKDQKYKESGQDARRFVSPDAAEKIVDVLQSVERV